MNDESEMKERDGQVSETAPVAEKEKNPEPAPEQKPEKPKTRLQRIFCSRNRQIVLFLLLGTLLGFIIVPGGKTVLRNFLYSFLPTDPTFIELPADPYENGKTHGKECKFSIKLLCKIYLKKQVCRNDEKILEKQSGEAEDLFATIDQRWTEEIKGLSEGCKVDKGQLMLANSFLDIGLAKIGCRQVVLDSKGIDPASSQRLLHAHNLDWDNLGGVGNYLVTVFRKAGDEERFATVRMGFPGLIGALTIINEKGISLGFDQVGSATEECKMPIFIAMRDIAETCATFEDAEKRLLGMPQGMPFCILMADAKTGQAAVFERSRSQDVQMRKIRKGILTADNGTWCDRDMSFCTVDRVAREYATKSGDLDVMKKILRDKQVLLGCNIYSVIFDYQNNTFYLAAGKIPAAYGSYVKYELFKK